MGRGWTVLGDNGKRCWQHGVGGLIIKWGNNYGVNELEPQSLGWKGKGEIAADKLKNFPKAELSKRPDVQD